MTYEETFRVFVKADIEYQDLLVSAFAKRKEEDYNTRMTLAKNDVRLDYPVIWEKWNQTHEEYEVIRLQLNERMVQAHENMSFKPYKDKLTN